MYPTDSLNVWEYKLSNWLKLYDNNNENDENYDEQQQVII